jgi:hypothetical protein
MRNAPYVSTLYNPINTFVHALQGTLFQHGPAPITSPVARIVSALARNPSNLPPNMRPNTVSPAAPPQGPQQVTPGQFNSVFGSPNAYPGSFGNFGMLPGERSVGPPIAGMDPRTGQPIYNARGTVAPPPTPLQQGLTAVGNYAQGTVNDYGGGSDLQQLSLLRQLGLDNTPTNNGLFGGYSAPWNLAQASGATSGGGINPALRFGGASPGFLVH